MMFMSLLNQHYSRRRNKPRVRVRIIESVRFFICSVAFFIRCYLCEALEGPISSVVCIFLHCCFKRDINIIKIILLCYIYVLSIIDVKLKMFVEIDSTSAWR